MSSSEPKGTKVAGITRFPGRSDERRASLLASVWKRCLVWKGALLTATYGAGGGGKVSGCSEALYQPQRARGEGQGRILDPGARASKCDERSGKRRNLRGIHVTSQSEMAPRGGSWAGPPEAKPILYTPADGPWRACERRPRATMAGAAPAEVSHGQPVHLSARAREKRFSRLGRRASRQPLRRHPATGRPAAAGGGGRAVAFLWHGIARELSTGRQHLDRARAVSPPLAANDGCQLPRPAGIHRRRKHQRARRSKISAPPMVPLMRLVAWRRAPSRTAPRRAEVGRALRRARRLARRLSLASRLTSACMRLADRGRGSAACHLANGARQGARDTAVNAA